MATQHTTTQYKHILLNQDHVPTIAGTTMKVVELITSVKAYGWTPEELLANYPYLSLSKIYSALAYYWDHQDAMDTEVEHCDQTSEPVTLEMEMISLTTPKDPLKLLELAGIVTDAPRNACDRAEDNVL